jgi:hypothetical protein
MLKKEDPSRRATTSFGFMLVLANPSLVVDT